VNSRGLGSLEILVSASLNQNRRNQFHKQFPEISDQKLREREAGPTSPALRLYNLRQCGYATAIAPFFRTQQFSISPIIAAAPQAVYVEC
jgi:hypothetical protein